MIRKILEAIAEKELHPSKGLGDHPKPEVTDKVEELLSIQAIDIKDWSRAPSSTNPVEMWVMHDEATFNTVSEWVQGYGFLWTWDEPHHIFRLSPGPDQTVAVFWNKIVELVDRYYEMVDINPHTGEPPYVKYVKNPYYGKKLGAEKFKSEDDTELDEVYVDWLIENVELNSDAAVFDLRTAQDMMAKHGGSTEEITVGDVWGMLEDETHTAVQLAWTAHKQSQDGGEG